MSREHASVVVAPPVEWSGPPVGVVAPAVGKCPLCGWPLTRPSPKPCSYSHLPRQHGKDDAGEAERDG